MNRQLLGIVIGIALVVLSGLLNISLREQSSLQTQLDACRTTAAKARKEAHWRERWYMIEVSTERRFEEQCDERIGNLTESFAQICGACPGTDAGMPR